MKNNVVQEQIECIKCHGMKNLDELIKNSKYKDVQKYICKKCQKDRVALQRNMRKLKNVAVKQVIGSSNVAVISESVAVNVAVENEPVSTPYNPVAVTQEEAKLRVIEDRKRMIEKIMTKTVPVTTHQFNDDVQIVSLKDEVPDFYV